MSQQLLTIHYPLLAHSNHFHGTQRETHEVQPHKSIEENDRQPSLSPSPEITEDGNSQTFPIIIEMESAQSTQVNNFWGEGLFALLVIFPFLLFSVKKFLHQ